MATINLKVTSDFDKASKDLQQFGTVTEKEQKRIQRFQESFKTEQIDQFIDRNRRLGAAITATGSPTEAMIAQQKALERQMQALIKKGLDPQDAAIQELAKEYQRLDNEQKQVILSQQALEKGAKAAQVALAGIAIGIGLVIGKTTLLASDAAELQNKFNVVFSGIRKDTEAWIDEYSNATARGSLETKEFLTSLQDIQTGFGASIPQASKFSQAVVGVTNDLVSFSNVPFEQASAAIQSGLSGQFRALQGLGVGINVAILDQTEYVKSLGKTYSELSNVEKREAILTEIINQSKNAVGQTVGSWEDYNFMLGDAAKTSESFANQAKETPGILKDIGSIIGTAFLPFAEKSIKAMNDWLAGIRTFLREGDNLTKVLDIIGVTLAGVTAGLITFLAITKGAAALQAIIGAFKALNAVMAANPIALIATVIVAVVIPAIILLIKNWDKVTIFMSEQIELLKQRFVLFANLLKTAFIVSVNAIKIGFISLGEVIVTAVLGKIEDFLRLAGKLPFVGEKFQGLADNVAGVTENFQAMTLEAKKSSAEAILTAAKEREELKHTTAQNIENIRLQADIRREELEKLKKENKQSAEEDQAQVANSEKAITDIQTKALVDRLAVLNNVEAQAQMERMTTFDEFLKARMEQEQITGEERIAFLQSELERIKELETISNKEKLTAIEATEKEITRIKKEETAARVALQREELQATANLFDSLGQILEEGAKENRAAAIAARLLASASAGINSYLAFTKTLADGGPFPLNAINAAAVLASGLAQQIKINSTQLPTAQTGTPLGGIEVPRTASGRADNVAAYVSEGENLKVTPRGETSGNLNVNVNLEGNTIIKFVNEKIESGEIRITADNIQAGVV